MPSRTTSPPFADLVFLGEEQFIFTETFTAFHQLRPRPSGRLPKSHESFPRPKLQPRASCAPSPGRGRPRFPPAGCSARPRGRVFPRRSAPQVLAPTGWRRCPPHARRPGPGEAGARRAEEGAGARARPALACSRSARATRRRVCAVSAPGARTAGRAPLRGASGSGSGSAGPAGARGGRADAPRGFRADTRAHGPGGAFSEAALPRPDGERQCLPAQRTLAPRLPPRRRLLLGTASPSAAPGREAAAAGPTEPLCVQPGEGRRRNHLTEARALDAPSARMRRRR